MPQTIKATSETTLLNQSFNKCSSTTSKLLQKAQFIDLYQQIKQNHSRSEDYYSLHDLYQQIKQNHSRSEDYYSLHALP
jgi:hypothetical protein